MVTRGPARISVFAALTALVVVAACSPAPATGTDAMRGLVTLGSLETGDLHAWVGPTESAPVETAVEGASGVNWMAASVDGRLATVSANAVIRVSSVLSASDAALAPSWSDVEVIDSGTHTVPGPYTWPAWDPAGERVAFLTGDGTDDVSLVVVDVESGAAMTAPLNRPDVYGPPIWVSDELVALAVGDLEEAVETLLVSATSGQATSMGVGRRLWAAAPTAKLVLTSTRPANGPMTIQSAQDWLTGKNTTIATLPEPDGVGGYFGEAFDTDGSRVAIGWVDASKAWVEMFDADTGWKSAGSSPRRDRHDPLAVAWLP